MTQFQLAAPSPPIGQDRFADARLQASLDARTPRGWLGTVGDAISSEWSAGWVSRFVSRMGMADDPDWRLDRETFDSLMEGMPADMGEEFANTRSLAHAQAIRDSLIGVARSRARLEQRGWTGTGMRMLAAMTDPADILAGAAASAAFGPQAGLAASAARKFGRIERMVQAGLIGVAGNLPNQFVLSGLDPEQDWRDVVYTAAGGFMGGNLGAAFKAPPRTKLASAARAAGIGATTGATISTGAQLAQGDLDIGQVATAAFFGGTGGGVLGIAGARGDQTLDQRISEAMYRQRTSTEFRDVLDGAMGAAASGELRGRTMRELVEQGILTDKGRIAFARDLDPQERARTIERLVSESGLDVEQDAEIITRLRAMDPDDALAELHGRMPMNGILVKGAPTTIAADRRNLSARYAVVEAENLVPSHNPRLRSNQGGFARNPAGDENERPYHDPSQAWQSIDVVLRIGREPRPEFLLSDTTTAVDGPPIVAADGRVLGGNARTMGVQLAYADDVKAGTLKTAALEAAAKFGIDRGQIESMNHPVIVRVVDDAGAPGELSRLLNEGVQAGRSEFTLAASAAAKVSNATALVIGNRLQADDDASLRSILADPANAIEIVNRLQRDGAWSAAEIARHWDERAGRITESGKIAIEQMLVARIVGDIDLASQIPASTSNKLLAALPDLLRSESSGGEAANLITLLRVAIDNYVEWRNMPEPRETVADRLFNQTYLTGDPPGYRNLTVASLMNGIIHMPQRKFATAIGRIVDEASDGEGLLGGGQPVSLRRAVYEAMGTELRGAGVDELAARLDEPEDVPAVAEKPRQAAAPEAPQTPQAGIRGPTIVSAPSDIRRAGEGTSGPPSDFEIRVVDRLEREPELSIAEARIAVIRDMADEFGQLDEADLNQSGSPGRPSQAGGVDGPVPPPPDSPPPREPKRPGDFDLSGLTSAKAAHTWARGSFASLLGSSQSDMVRMAATAYADDAMAKADGSGQRLAASTWVRREATRRMATFTRDFNAAFDAWAQRKGTRIHQRGGERKRFAEEAGRGVRLPRGFYSDPDMNRAIDAGRALFQDVLETAKRHGANGFEAIETRDDYFPRILRHQLLNQATRIYGDDSVHRLVETALAGGGAFEAADIPAIARAYIKTWRDLDRWVDSDKAMLHDARPDIFEEIMLGEGWSPEKIKNTIKQVFGDTESQRGVQARARRRTILDESASIQTPVGILRFEDLLDNNVERVAANYTREVLGAAAAAEVYRAVAGEKVRTFAQLKDRLGTQMNKLKIDSERIDRDLKFLETLDRHIRGFPLSGNNFLSRNMRRIRGYNHIRLSGQFGFAQLPEVVAMIGETGLRTQLTQLPALRQIFSLARNGKLYNELLATIETVWGFGTDRLLNRFHDRIDELDGVDRTIGRIDSGIQSTIRLANDVSGMSAINMASQRWAAVMAIQKWHDLARSDRIPSRRRLNAMGISEADARRVIKAMREEADAGRGVKMEPGILFGRRVADIDFSKWADQNAAAILVDAVDKWARRVIQENDIGNMHPWVQTDLGRLILQFRSFTIGAWEKQLLHRLQMRDWEAFSSAMLGIMAAGLVYVGQTYTQSIGLPERERKEFLEKRLSNASIAAASFQRGAVSSLLPSFADTALPFFGEDPVFNFRQTGLSTPLFSLDSNPSIQLVGRDILRAGRGITSAARDDRVIDRADVMSAANLLPFQQVIGIRNALRAFAAQFPENDRQ